MRPRPMPANTRHIVLDPRAFPGGYPEAREAARRLLRLGHPVVRIAPGPARSQETAACPWCGRPLRLEAGGA